VLVVDDEPELTRLYSAFLEPVYDVVTARSEETALAQVDESVDVVLLDRRMPDLSGDEVLARLDELSLDVQVTMLTAVEPKRGIVALPFDEYAELVERLQELKAEIDVTLEEISAGTYDLSDVTE